MCEIKSQWDRNILHLAYLQSKKSLCLRKKVGAVIVNPQKEILVQTFNQNPYGLKNCIDFNQCLREIRKIPSGINYEETCPILHAEQMAISSIGFAKCEGGIMYVFGHSLICTACKKYILQAKIKKVILQLDKNTQPTCYYPPQWLDSLHGIFFPKQNE